MTPTTKIPFLDLVTPHQELEAELIAVAKKAFSTAGFIGGPMVEDFEREFAAFCDAKYCVGVNSGTDALRFAFMAAGVGQGDIIVTVPHTFIATTEAISQAGAQIAFVDIDESTYTMDPAKLREYFETRVRFRQQDQETQSTQEWPARGRHRSRASLRADRGHGSHHGAGGEVQPGGHRRCLPGARRGIFFEKRKQVEKGRIDGPGRGVQLLSGQESGSLRRSRRDHDQR